VKTHPARLIQKKRDGHELADDEILDVVSGVVDRSMVDAQLGAFLMAVLLRGMTPRETASLTRAMRDSGVVMPRCGDAPRVDKHSTGGVGDKPSLLLAPWVASCGVHVPMISGRGLGHTGGTIDKLQSIPGYRTSLSTEEFTRVLSQCGFAMASASQDIAPADGRMYATRDVSGTVESVPLITSSILAKKLAENLDGLVMDVKCGRAAFMQSADDADRLLQSIFDVGTAAGVRVTAMRTDMDHPLGLAHGNALEVLEILDCLEGKGPSDTMDLTTALAVEMVLLAGVETDSDAARSLLDRKLRDGSVTRCLQRNLELQGGDPRVLDDRSLLARAPFVEPVLASRDGYVDDVDPLAIGHAIVDLGGGRRASTDAVDPAVGVVLAHTLGEPVRSGEPLAFVHARTKASAAACIAAVQAAMPVGDRPKLRRALVQRRVSAT
jgi:pyrimidine-nucleoside phosphorylase